MEYVWQRVLNMGLPGKRKRGRPKRRYMDALAEDMKIAGVQEKDTQDRIKWKQAIRCGDPRHLEKSLKTKKKNTHYFLFLRIEEISVASHTQ